LQQIDWLKVFSIIINYVKEISKAARIDGLFTKSEVKIDDITLK